MKFIFRREQDFSHRFVLWQGEQGTVRWVPEWLLSMLLMGSIAGLLYLTFSRETFHWPVVLVVCLIVTGWFDKQIKLPPWKRP